MMKTIYCAPSCKLVELPPCAAIAQTSVQIYQKPADESEAEVKEQNGRPGQNIWEEW